MDCQEIEQKTYELLDELRTGEPIGFYFTPDLAYLILTQLDLALDHPSNQDVEIPSDLMDFKKALRTEILKRCSPKAIEFLRVIIGTA